mmetsp:Transcript_30006/g.64984  ORF Transcript_30006/g.64984 Transcript_30006/m.64984 type:complete len:229 (-) Transcript_30006:1253-1939(-)
MASNSNNNLSGPTCNDIICGRGGLGPRHVGNKNYRRLVEANVELYQSSKKFDKIKLAKRVVDYIHKQNPRGRFVKREKNGVWAELDAKAAVRKTSQTFRDIIGEQKSRCSENDQTSDGSHASSTDSMISELYAQAEATTNGSSINSLVIPEETTIEPAAIEGEPVPGGISFVSDSDRSLSRWLDEGGKDLFDVIDLGKGIPDDSDTSRLTFPSFDSSDSAPLQRAPSA